MSLSILLDATPYLADRPTGAGRYVVNLLAELAKQDGTNRYRVFGFENTIPGAEKWGDRFVYDHLERMRWLGPLSREWARRSYVRKRLNAGGIDVVHFTLDPVALSQGDVPSVLTLYDVMRLSDDFIRQTPQTFRSRLRTRRRYSLAGRMTHLCTISAYSKAEIVQKLGIADRDITVTPLAAAEHFTPGPADSDVLAGFDLEVPYVLFVGEFGRQKNEEGLVRAFFTMLQMGHAGDGVKLVLVGQRQNLPSGVRELIENHPQKKRVVFPGVVDDSALLTLYRGAAVLAMPSFVEGFGLPVLEAMACQVPVVAANRSSLPEIVKDTGLLVDPESTEQIAVALDEVFADPNAARHRARRALDRAAAFSYKNVAITMIDLYRKLTKKQGTKGG